VIKAARLWSGEADAEAWVALSEASETASRGALAGLLARVAAWRADGSDRSIAQRIAGAAFLIRMLSAAIIYVSQVLLARWMGRFEFGVYVYVWTWVGFLGMASSLGLAFSAQRFIPEYRARGDLDGLRGFLVGSRLLCLGLGTAFGALMAGTVAALSDRIEPYYLVPFLFASLTLPIFAVSSMQDATARAFNWIDLALIPGFISHPLAILVVTSAIYFAGGVITSPLALAIACAALWAVILMQLVLLNRRIRANVAPGPRRYEPWQWLRNALPVFLVESFFLLLTYVDTLVLQLFVGPADIAVYYAATKTLAIVNFIYFAVGAACGHRFSEYHMAGERDRLAAFVADAVRWTFWPSLAAAAIMLVLGEPILHLFGPGFTDGYPLICIMIVGLLARAAVGPAERLLNMIGQQNACAAVYGCAFAVNLVLCLALIPYFGLTGAAIATASALLVESTLLFVVTRRRLGLHLFIWRGPGRP
jgi:O-antigen/teichoic acid export membrane protein